MKQETSSLRNLESPGFIRGEHVNAGVCKRHEMSGEAPTAAKPTVRWVVGVVRFGILGLITILAARNGELDELAIPLTLLTIIAALSTVPARSSRVRVAKLLVEAAGSALVLGAAGTFPDPLLPYLIIPPLAAGIEAGFLLASTATGVIAAVLLMSQWLVSGLAGPAQFRSAAQWAGLGLAAGVVGACARKLHPQPSETGDTYGAAHLLLSQLREVARTLPAGLDEVSLDQTLLLNLRSETPYDRAALYKMNDRAALYEMNDRHRLLASAIIGADRIEWDPETTDNRWAQAIATRQWSAGRGSLTDPHNSDAAGAVLPLRLDDRSIGVVAIERDGPVWSGESLDAAQSIMDGAALQVDAGRLFSEVRALATMEERRRLAREIHDGIAQEVASLGYAVDAITADVGDDRQREQLAQLRVELTRIVNELRLSIFDLRSDVAPDTGLGAALSSYVRQVGMTSGLTVHLVLDESSQRLAVAAETELLRIAQEAVTNVRKHSQAANLWVTCRVAPPAAFLRIADDGQGRGSPRIDSYGLEIMRERASRLGAKLSVRDRVDGGTVVEVTVGLGS